MTADHGDDARIARQDPSRLRISDEDRHRVAEVLRQAAGEGRLDLDELDDRLQAAYEAKTYGDLVPITADLPVPGAPGHRPVAVSTPGHAPGSAPELSRYSGSVAILSQTNRRGPWLLQDGHTAFALMGGVVLDLREARFTAPEVTVNASAVMGDVKIIVDAGTRVVVDGVAIMGDFCEQRAKVPFEPAAAGRVVRVRGVSLMGSVKVQRRGAPGERGRRALRRS